MRSTHDDIITTETASAAGRRELQGRTGAADQQPHLRPLRPCPDRHGRLRKDPYYPTSQRQPEVAGDADGKVTTYAFDDLNRTKSVIYRCGVNQLPVLS